MRIGVDLDNTVAGFDRLFRDLAIESGLFETPPAADRRAIRDALRRRGPSGEVAWQELQALAYGPRMVEAELAPGAARFLAACRERSVPVWIVSHKSRFARRDAGRCHDLRAAALAWLARQGAFDAGGLGLTRERVRFADDRDSKVAEIGRLELRHFIDDLREVLEHRAFPAATTGHLVDLGDPDGATGWDAVHRAILG